jgi:hypothetical protein
MKTSILAAIFLSLILMYGCGSSGEVKEIRELRSSGKQKEARDRALAVLKDSPKNTAVWQEFARVDIEIFRMERMQSKEPNMAYLIEASLVCIAYSQKAKNKPSEAWRDLGVQVFSMVSNECNAMIGAMQRQEELANYLHDMIVSKSNGLGSERSIEATTGTVEEYRDQASALIARLAICFALIEQLPENSKGTRDILKSQTEKEIDEWMRDLDIETSLKTAIWNKNTAAVETAIENSQLDFSDIGYLQIATITQNKVL